jgi:hypothetical protein
MSALFANHPVPGSAGSSTSLDYFRFARQPSMIASSRDQIGGLPITQDLPVRRAGTHEAPIK